MNNPVRGNRDSSAPESGAPEIENRVIILVTSGQDSDIIRTRFLKHTDK